MANTKLVLNTDKTYPVIMTSAEMHNFSIVLDTGQEIIEPVQHERLLGAEISNNFKFNVHIRDGEKSMMNILTSRTNALRKIACISSFKTRKMIAEGIIMSNIMYIITVYGSCSEYLKDSLQVVQNTAARCVTGLAWNTSVAVLLLQCGWLSVRQLILFHSMVMVFKIKQESKPRYLHTKVGVGGRGYNFQKVFLMHFLAKSVNSKHFFFLFIFSKKILIVVTIFASHLQK